MIIGAHSIIYSTNPEADRAFLRNVLKLPHIDVGHGWLIFGLPPAEVAVHPADKNDVHELYLMCDDLEGFIEEMRKGNLTCGPVETQGWGLVSQPLAASFSFVDLSPLSTSVFGAWRLTM
jgi:hypothetical protein